MSNAHDAALAFCLGTYIQPSAVESKIVTKPIKVKPAKASAKVESPPANKTPPPPSMNLQHAGTIDARTFLKRRATAKNRDEQIAALAAYIGYDHTAPFGVQDSAAADQAKQAIKPVAAGKTPFSRGSFASVQGFVAGQPDHAERSYQNLLARERLAVNTMLDHEKAAREAKTAEERTLYAGLALVERERLIEIRKDLRFI
jgi:hypothetical protein